MAVAFLSFCKNAPVFQFMILQYLNLAIIMYTSFYRPLMSRFNNNLEIFNEYLIGVATISVVCFTDYISDLEM